MTRDFPLGTVLSVTDGRLLSPDGIGGIYAILNFLTGDDLFTHQPPRASDECRPWLLRQHSWLDGPEIRSELAELGLLLAKDRAAGPSADPEAVVRGWLAKLEGRFPANIPVEPIPTDDHDVIDPIEEAERMFGKDRVRVVELED